MPDDKVRQLELALCEYIERYGFLPRARAYFMEEGADVFETAKARLEQLKGDHRPS